MRITFDPAKDETNREKHGVSLLEAKNLEWETLCAMPDNRKDYGEARMIGYALNGERLYCVVYTDRGSERRVISLRKANEREVRSYVSEN